MIACLDYVLTRCSSLILYNPAPYLKSAISPRSLKRKLHHEFILVFKLRIRGCSLTSLVFIFRREFVCFKMREMAVQTFKQCWERFIKEIVKRKGRENYSFLLVAPFNRYLFRFILRFTYLVPCCLLTAVILFSTWCHSSIDSIFTCYF